MKSKLKLIVLFIFCFVIFTSTVQAVDQVYQAIVYWETGRPAIIYRTMVRPFSTTERNIIFDEQNNYNEWLSPSTSYYRPIAQTYSSKYLIFTKEQIADYYTDDSSYYAYYQYAPDENTGYLLTSSSIEDFETWWNHNNGSHEVVRVEDKWLYEFETNGEYTTKANISLANVDSYLNNILSIGETKTLISGYVTQNNQFKGNQNITFTEKLVPYAEARRMLYNSNYGDLTRTELYNILQRGNITGTLYVSDILVNEDATAGILDYLNKEKTEGRAGDSIYVSAISETLAWNKRDYFYMLTPENFLHAKSNTISHNNWTLQTLGKEGNGEWSGLNLWDNQLIINSEPKDKTIVINHVYVDERGNFVNIDRQEAVSLYVNGDSIWAASNSANIKSDESGNYQEKYKVSSDITEYAVKNLKELDAGRIWTAENGFELKPNQYHVAGYAVYTDISTNIGNVGSTVNRVILEANNHAKYKAGNLSSTGEFTLSDSENIAVVNVYYTVPTVDVEVRHYCVGNFYVTGNGYGTKSNGDIYPYTSMDPTYGFEYYENVSLYDAITFSNKTNLGGLYNYIGYDLNNTDVNNTNVVSDAPSYTVTQDSVTTEDGKIIIVFKYAIQDVANENKPAPQLNIGGTLSIDSISGIDAICQDIYSVPTNAKDNKNDIYVGIRQIPNYILAGMNVKQLTHSDSNVKINITIKFGPNSEKWTVEVPYYLSYYVVENLLIYKFNNAEVYNTKTGEDTSGDRLFANIPNDNKRTIRPTQTSTLTLWGAANSNITNDRTNIDNWKNYLATSYKTNYISTVDPNRATTILSNPYDNEEKKDIYRRDNEEYPGYGDNRYGVTSIELDHGATVNNDIDKYISYKSIDTDTVNALRTAYTKIGLDKEANIEITLLSNSVFYKIDSNGNEEIDIEDITNKIATTEDSLFDLQDALEEFIEAYDDYNSACSDVGYTFPCISAIENKYDNEIDSCESKTCDYKEECSGEGDDKECVDIPIPCKCSECSGCSDARDDYRTVSPDASTYTSKRNAYIVACNVVSNNYAVEKYALQHYDEAYYIQENLWDVYKNYNTEQIIKLLDLDIKLDYSSGGAKLGSTELLTVTSHTVVLDTQPSKDIVLGGHPSTLSSTKSSSIQDKLTLGVVNLNAARQTLSETQKTYYTEGIKTASWIGEDISSNNYSNNEYTIPITALNGERVLAATSNYMIDTNNKIGEVGLNIYDNMYYNADNTKYGTIYSNVNGYTNGQKAEDNVIEYLYNIDVSNQPKYYGANKYNTSIVNGKKVNTVNSQTFNIYTPLVVNADVNQDIDVIDQTTDVNKYKNVDVIQANSNFTINLNSNYSESKARKVYTSSIPSDFTERYLNRAKYYVKFMFDVDNVKYIGSGGYAKTYGTYKSGEWIGPIYGDKLQATARINTVQGASITDITTEYYVLAAAVNTDASWTTQVLEQMKTSLSDVNDSNLLNNIHNNCGTEGGSKKISYYASTTGSLIIVNRMYDFRVTDVKDVDWKNVFRQNESSYYVNAHKGIAYYAGLSKWNTEDPTKYNEIVGRTEEEIGTSPTRVLPVGPYKNTDKSYIAAPKIGYRFSFDLKVTGAQDEDKSVTIKPTFYYISKDGKTYYPEYTNSGTGIYLFYKNNQGQYVKIGSSQDTYKIQFVPNDGYRALVQAADKHLSKSNVVLGGLRELTLKFNDTTTYSENDTAITYYGEYKLPNSTIAVLVDENGRYNINTPLSNGYIGVVFDIYANEANKTVLSYGKNSYIPGGSTVANPNTSQWDYEGYLGISKPGSEYSTTLRLEKGTWQIDNTMYNKIKGTVMLYDIDNKASNDFN